MSKTTLSEKIELCIKEFNNPATLMDRRSELLQQLFELPAVESVVIYNYGIVSPTLEKLQAQEKRLGARPRYAKIGPFPDEECLPCLMTYEPVEGGEIGQDCIMHDCISLEKITLGADLLFDSAEGGIFLLKMTVS